MAPAPVFPEGKIPHLRIVKWSGREDSNLRPLPPEDVSPSRIPQLSVVSQAVNDAYTDVCSRSVYGRGSIRNLGALSFKLGWLLLIANEVRGFVLSLPVFAALIAEGGTLVAWWTALCALGGIALSVIVPGWLLKKMKES